MLLDTQVWLWMQRCPDRLGSTQPDRGIRETSRCSRQQAEIAIKFALGRLPQPVLTADPQIIRYDVEVHDAER